MSASATVSQSWSKVIVAQKKSFPLTAAVFSRGDLDFFSQEQAAEPVESVRYRRRTYHSGPFFIAAGLVTWLDFKLWNMQRCTASRHCDVDQRTTWQEV